jgi:hypothetical protein
MESDLYRDAREKMNADMRRSRLPGVSDAYAKDVGMLAALALIILHVWRGSMRPVYAAGAVLLLSVLWPGLIRPLARLWLAGGRILGALMSHVILAVIYFALLTPRAWMTRLFRHDPLRLRLFKKNGGSVFVNRDREFTAKDLEKPY